MPGIESQSSSLQSDTILTELPSVYLKVKNVCVHTPKIADSQAKERNRGKDNERRKTRYIVKDEKW
jgi:hypothetical protein